MMNPYGGSGNLIGIAWVGDLRSPRSYVEVVFSPRGQARINAVTNGVRTVLAEAPYQGGGPNKWFDVEVTSFGDLEGDAGQVKVNGLTVFERVPGDDLRDSQIGLISHWAPAKFDDARFTLDIFRPFAANFDDGRLPRQMGATESWRLENGRLHATGISVRESAIVQQAYQLVNIDYRVRMVNHYGSTGNLVGLIYGLEGGRWFEVTFSPTGVARLTRVQEGVTKVIATASYSGGGPNVWFNVQLIQRDQHTTVRVNGTTVFDNVSQPDLGHDQVGLVTHWADAEFDDLSIQQVP
jgi:hypothetical protein